MLRQFPALRPFGRASADGTSRRIAWSARATRQVEERVELLHSGKVRDVYADRGDLLLVASDRVSIYDVVLPTAIPDKGKILTQLSLWWFDQLSDVAPNHIISATDVPQSAPAGPSAASASPWSWSSASLAGTSPAPGSRTTTRTAPSPGTRCRTGLIEGSRLPEPIFTPSTKVAPGEGHDETITYEDVVAQEGPDVAAELKRITLEVYRRGSEIAAGKGIIIADTKIELGFSEGALKIGDELLTPDSSRFWAADEWTAGRYASLPGQAVPAGLVGHRACRTGTGPHPVRRSRSRSSRRPATATSRCTSDLPATSGVRDGSSAVARLPRRRRRRRVAPGPARRSRLLRRCSSAAPPRERRRWCRCRDRSWLYPSSKRCARSMRRGPPREPAGADGQSYPMEVE